MSHIKVKKIYQDENFIGYCNILSTINSDKVTDVKEAWLIRKDGPIQFNIDFKDPGDGYAVKGVWLNEAGKGILVDGTLADVQAALNECCGEDTTVAGIYNGVYPDIYNPVLKTYTVTREDNGSFLAQKDMLLAYQSWIGTNNSFSRTSRNNGTGVSTYTFQSYTDPAPQAVAKNGTVVTDTVTQTPLAFDSNTVAAAPGGGNHYELTVTADGLPVGTPSPITNATSIASLVTALNANATYTAKGTYTAVGATAVRLSSTNIDRATLVIAVVPD